ncbi:MAG: hypothetical protein WC333_02050 [Dehalococcoidia bacterium]|jgi:hypothetical protein
MKYTKYLLKGDYINIEQFENKEHPLYNFPLVAISIPLTVALLGGIIVMLPVTITFDNGRWLWYKWLLYDRKYNLSYNVQKTVTNMEAYRIIDHGFNKLTHGINEQTNILSGSFATLDGRGIKKGIERLHLIRTNGNRRSEMPNLWPKRMVAIAKSISLSA